MSSAQEINYQMGNYNPDSVKANKALQEIKSNRPEMKLVRIDSKTMLEVPATLSDADVLERVEIFKERGK